MSAPRAIAIAGCALAAVGLLGFIIYPRAMLLWAIPVVFGARLHPHRGPAGHAILVALVLRLILRGGERDLIVQHWPGPENSLDLVLRLVGRS